MFKGLKRENHEHKNIIKICYQRRENSEALLPSLLLFLIMKYSGTVLFVSTNKLLFSETFQSQFQFIQAYSSISGYIICTVYKAKAYHFVVMFWTLPSVVTNRTTIGTQLTERRRTYMKNAAYIRVFIIQRICDLVGYNL